MATPPRNVLRDAWKVLSRLPGGRRLFSRIVGRMAPYTASIRATIVELRPGYAQVEMADRRAVRNHLDSIHAVALVNLAELCGNVALFYSLPEGSRFIVSGITIEYVKKARGTITAVSECPIPAPGVRAEYKVPVVLRDASGADVAHAVLRSLVGPIASVAKPRPTVDRAMVN
jgi:acyl-coenzyme A thioesterase PaaI-like protein